MKLKQGLNFILKKSRFVCRRYLLLRAGGRVRTRDQTITSPTPSIWNKVFIFYCQFLSFKSNIGPFGMFGEVINLSLQLINSFDIWIMMFITANHQRTVHVGWGPLASESSWNNLFKNSTYRALPRRDPRGLAWDAVPITLMVEYRDVNYLFLFFESNNVWLVLINTTLALIFQCFAWCVKAFDHDLPKMFWVSQPLTFFFSEHDTVGQWVEWDLWDMVISSFGVLPYGVLPYVFTWFTVYTWW
jgi:hypothetical protein